MLLIVGGERDVEALSAVDLLGTKRSLLLDATDLSRPGWNLPTGEPGRGLIIAGGKQVPVENITGVLVRRLAVYPQELSHVQEPDRNYVASEMTALLTWWLCSLPVPVINKPGAGVLCGPGLRSEQWRALAAQLGYSVVGSVLGTCPSLPQPLARTFVVVIGDSPVGDPPDHLACRTLALAAAGNAVMLWASFNEDDQFIDAHTMPPLTPDLLTAVSRHVRLPT